MAGKHPDLYNSAGEPGRISSVCGRRQKKRHRRNMTISEQGKKKDGSNETNKKKRWLNVLPTEKYEEVREKSEAGNQQEPV